MIIMLKGLPASGKTTWAKDMLDVGVTRVNKDDLRAMMHYSRWSKANEKLVLNVRDAVITEALGKGHTVIVDDTNLAPKHEARLRQLADACEVPLSIKDFTDVPLDVCLERNRKRSPGVPEAVIRQMYDQFLKPEPPVVEYNFDLPDAIIVDIDGTLALNRSGRSPYDWERVSEDTLNEEVAEIVDSHRRGGTLNYVILMSGRDSVCRGTTERWLGNNRVRYDHLWMRPHNDGRKDSIVKRELYEKHVKGKFNVKFVLDDRDQVVDMWRNELGLTCWQVASGAF